MRWKFAPPPEPEPLRSSISSLRIETNRSLASSSHRQRGGLASWIRRAGPVLLFLLCTPPFLSSVQSQVDLEARLGFHGLFQLGEPFPLTVNLFNSGQPVEGTLEVEVWKGGPAKGIHPYVFTYRKEVFLAAQSPKSIPFTVEPDSMAKPLTVRFLGPQGELSQEIDLRGHFSPSPLILLLAGHSGFPFIPMPLNQTAPVVALAPDELPSDIRAYQGVWAILIYEQSLRDMSRSQRKGLEGWLLSGGRMLILGGVHYALYREPTIRAFLPVEVFGLKTLEGLPNLQKYYGQELPLLKDVLVLDSKLVEGEALVTEGEIPVVVEMRRGKGKVVYLALDVGRPPLSQWRGLSVLFSDLLGRPPERRLGSWTVWDDTVFSRLMVGPALVDVRVGFIFTFFLLLYLGGLALLGWLWKQRKSLRALGLSFSAFVLAITFGGSLYMDRGIAIPNGVLVVSTVLEANEVGYADAQTNVGLFSTREGDFSFQLARGWTDLEMVPSRFDRSENSSVVVQDGILRSTDLRFRLAAWQHKLFTIRTDRSFPLRVEADWQGERLSLSLVNGGDQDLVDCWLILSGKSFSLGAIPRGSRRSWTFVVGESNLSDRNGIHDIVFNDRRRQILFNHSIFPEDERSLWSAVGMVVGWVEGGSRRVWADDRRISSHSLTLFRAIISFPGEEEL